MEGSLADRGGRGAAAGGADSKAAPVELFFDLVFVFVLTQVTAYLAADLSWSRMGEGMLLLGLLWWAWSAYAWVANVSDRNRTEIRAFLFASMLALFYVALTMPEAFGDQATTFAVAYTAVRVLHVALYKLAAKRGRARWSGIAGFVAGAVCGCCLLIIGSWVGGSAQIVLWTAALAVDLAGPYLTRGALRELQDVGVSHFAERFGLFVILCLGESIVAVGVGVKSPQFDAVTAVAVGLCLLVTVGLWWTYFDYVATAAEHQLGHLADPVSAARDAYSYAHAAIVAGIIIFAVGAKKLVAQPEAAMKTGALLAFCGGVALYLVGHLAFRRRMTGTWSAEKATAAAAMVVVFVAGTMLPAWSVAGVVVAVLAVLCGRESLVEGALRHRLRSAS